jgi:uncharacterized protein (TIGR03435 family)
MMCARKIRGLAIALAAAAAFAAVVVAAQQPVPQWQIDAGGAAKFDVASVKRNKSGSDCDSNVSLNNGAGFVPTGGLFSAMNCPLFRYISFAYKLNGQQVGFQLFGLPSWAWAAPGESAERFDVEARASGNPTKDQYRLMVQALLADRFKLALHHEIRQGPVFALILLKPGQPGPQLQPHPDDQPCSTTFTPGHGLPRTGPEPSAPSPPSATTGLQMELVPCGIGNLALPPSASGRIRIGGRGLTMAEIAGSLGGDALIDRPIIDRTGLSGAFDYSLEWSQELHFAGPPPPDFNPDPNGPSLREALQKQLGVTLKAEKGAIDVIVVDHVEEPSAN